MIAMICDICKKPAQFWEFMRKHNIFKRHCTIEGSDKEKFDVCDECVNRIRKEIK